MVMSIAPPQRIARLHDAKLLLEDDALGLRVFLRLGKQMPEEDWEFPIFRQMARNDFCGMTEATDA